MRSIEVILGVLIMAAAVALGFGAAALFAPLPPPGPGSTLTLLAFGAAMAAHGMAGRATGNPNADAGLRWRAVFYAVAALSAALVIPLVVEVLDLVTVAGFPLGYYVAAQGLLVFFAILAFRAAMHLDALDDRTPSAPSAGDA